MIIRDATFEDCAQLLPIGREVHARTAFAAFPMNEAALQRLVVTMITFPNGFAKVAERNGKVVGALIGGVSDNQWGVRCASDLFLYSKGGTDKLIKEFRAWAGERGAKFIHITDLSGRKRYHQMMRKIGFHPCGLNFVGVP